tara:strand:- start:28255 stop:28605 length:351 start_codon:yes stop_codon:yes gene_type:complete
MNKFSENIDLIIKDSVDNYDGSYDCDNSFEQLLSMGELVDRLSIVNFKLFTLKDRVMDNKNDSEFCSWASVEDVRLVEERARLKRCIDEKLSTTIKRNIEKIDIGGFNAETKKYGQ